MNALGSVFLYSIQIILPFMGILIICCCFSSLFDNLSPKHPLIALYDKTNNKKIPITYWENSIGRDKHCDIVVESPAASRDHAVLCRRNEGWMISDTNSKAGVFLNSKRIEGSRKVCIGDTLQIGAVEFELNKSDVLPVSLKSSNMDKLKGKSYSGFSLLIMVSIFQILSATELCFSHELFNVGPLIILGFLLTISWVSYFISILVFKRVNFELEAIGIFLSGIGIMTSCGVDIKETHTQLLALGIGILFFDMIVAFIKDPDASMKWRPYIAIGAVLLLALNLVFGKVKNGSQNWITIGSYSFQPSELVKVAFIFFGTSTLQGIQTTKNLSGFILFSGVCMGALFLMGDFGTACIFFVVFILISFMRSGSIRTVILTCSSAILGFAFILKFKPYIVTRFSAWRHVWQHVNDTGYQQTRVLTYSASGGMVGLGLGKGCLKYVFAAPSDLVFGMLCEEWGVVLALTVVLAIAVLGIYARKASIRSRSAFYSIASCCGAGMLVFQMMMNVFGVVDIFPLTGVTLPFISLGGTSVISVWGVMAFIKASDERTYALKR